MVNCFVQTSINTLLLVTVLVNPEITFASELDELATTQHLPD